jgi:hypothetical protein
LRQVPYACEYDSGLDHRKNLEDSVAEYCLGKANGPGQDQEKN